jgi:hypothetical protein
MYACHHNRKSTDIAEKLVLYGTDIETRSQVVSQR